MLKTLTKREVAALFGKTPRTIQQWIDKDWIKSEKRGVQHFIPIEQPFGQLEKFTPPKPGPAVKEEENFNPYLLAGEELDRAEAIAKQK